MADWYCSSTGWTAVTAWSAALTATTGMIRRQLAGPTVGNERVWRCTTGGTTGGSEPSWTLTKASTTSDNGVVWTECTGNSAHQQDNGVTNSFAAPHARVENMIAWMAAGDRGFVSSDHTQTVVGAVTLAAPGSTCVFVSVDRTTGNIPPAAADITAGAAIAKTGATFNDLNVRLGDWTGFTFTCGTGTDNFININIANATGYHRFRECHFTMAGSGGSNVFTIGAGVTATVEIENCTFTGASTNGISAPGTSAQSQIELTNCTWAGTLPATLFSGGGAGELVIRASDLSNLSGSNTLFGGSAGGFEIFRARDCRFNASMPRVSMSNNNGDALRVEIINCDSGAVGYHNEWYHTAGAITTETTITLASGSTDGVQKFSHKFVSSANATLINPLKGPELSIWNTATGAGKTATVEIQSDRTLNNDEIWLELEYLGSASYPLATVADSGIATPITTPAAVTTSSATWDATIGSPAVFQKLQVAFTPNMVGMIIWRVKLARASQTVYVDPELTIT